MPCIRLETKKSCHRYPNNTYDVFSDSGGLGTDKRDGEDYRYPLITELERKQGFTRVWGSRLMLSLTSTGNSLSGTGGRMKGK